MRQRSEPLRDSSGAAAGVKCLSSERQSVMGGTDLFRRDYGYRVFLWYGDDAVVVLGFALVGFHGHAKLRYYFQPEFLRRRGAG